jgi:phosphoribosyl-ATP pyrophosphohydrolase/phosphoribosyl-AMP cyclohydrolase
MVFNSEGLIPVIVQDKWTSEVLMMAYSNKEALEKTLDTLLAKVRPTGPACHTGNRSCFFRNIMENGKIPDLAFLARLWEYLKGRSTASPTESYTAKLLNDGRDRVGQKVGEEGVETAIAIATGNRKQVSYETADLFYHSLVGLICTNIELEDVISELMKRHKPGS